MNDAYGLILNFVNESARVWWISNGYQLVIRASWNNLTCLMELEIEYVLIGCDF